MSKRMVWAALLALAMSCSGDDGPAKGALVCTGGERLELETIDVCVYQSPLLVETGFDCPAEAQYGSTYGNLTVCSPDENLPDDFFETVAEQFPDDVPTGDCMSVLCNLGQACDAGTCVDPDDNNTEAVASIELNPAQLEFGEVFATQPVVRSLTVTNRGNATLELSEVSVTGPFLYEDGPTQTVEPGAAVEISVSITNDTNREEEVTGTLSMTTNDPSAPAVTVALMAQLAQQRPLCGDMFEPNENGAEATATVNDTEYNAVLCMDEEDWWGFEVTEVSEHTMSIDGPAALDGVAAELFTFVDGAVVLTPHGRALTGTMDSIVATLAPGQYAWRLIAPPIPVAYALTLSTSAAMCQADANESNDTMGTASRSIEDAEVGTGYISGSICGADTDWYVLQDAGNAASTTLSAGGFLEIGVTAFWGEAPTLTLHGPSGPVAATSATASDANWTWEQLTYEIDVDGEYYVEVDAATDLLQYRFAGIMRADSTCTADIYEPNEDAASAALLSPQPGELFQVSDLHICDGDEDWYAIDLAEGASLLVDIYHSPAASFRIDLFKEGEAMARVSDVEVPTSVDQVTYDVPAGDGGRYLVRISNQVAGSSARHYLLNVITN